MNHDNELDPVDRLRAADPAGDVAPRPGFADEVIARMTGPAAEPAPVADLAAARARRRPRWLAIASVAASIAIVGAAGYGLGSTTGTNLAGGAAAPPISLQTGESREGNPEAGQEPAIGGGADDQRMSPLIYPPGYGRNHFSASGLSRTEGNAPAYAFDPRAASSADTVAALAGALGIGSPVELKDGSWISGPQDGSAPMLSVSLDGTLSFYYHNPRINPWLCGKETDVCEPTGVAPGEDAAIAALRSLVVAAGHDPGTFDFTSHVWEGSTTRTAEARLVIDGQRIDQAWSLEMAEGGVVNANGALADVVGLGQYPVVSEQEGFERLSDPRFGSSNWILPMAGREPAPVLEDQPMVEDQSVPEDQPAPEEWVPPTEPPATPSAGTSLSWPVNEVEIVSARLGLASQWQPDGSVLVVPAYEFTDAEGGVWSVIAVGNSKLDFESE